jgi:hypothetical protein
MKPQVLSYLKVILHWRVATRDDGKIKFMKSLLPSLFQREDLYPSLAKRGWGDFIKCNIHLFTEGLHLKEFSD